MPTQFYFFLSVFKANNNLKNIMANYHLHSMSVFLHYQIRFSCAHARVLVFEYKRAFFRAARAHADSFSKNCTQLTSWKIGQ